MNRAHGAIGRAADRVMALDNTSYGDERERAIFMEAATFGYVVTTYVTMGVALVAALLGALLFPVVLMVLVGLLSWSTIWYAGRRGVDVHQLAFRAEKRRQRSVAAVVFGGFALILAAMAYTIFAGSGLVPVPEFDVAGPDASGVLPSMVRGAVVGGGGGLLVGAVVLAVKSRRSGRAEVADDDADED